MIESKYLNSKLRADKAIGWKNIDYCEARSRMPFQKKKGKYWLLAFCGKKGNVVYLHFLFVSL